MSALYLLRIHQFASKGIEPYCDWFTQEEVEEYLSNPENRTKCYIEKEELK
jgi:hypothetical protein